MVQEIKIMITMMNLLTKEQKVYYTLRIASAMCFIGHGAFGIIKKAIWCNYFAVFGIGHDLAYHLMPLLGSIDIILGLSLLLYPTRAVLFWLVIWGTLTAVLRPLSGEPFAEFIERAGNFGAPLALLILLSFKPRAINWLKKVKADYKISPEQMKKLQLILRCIAFLLLVGHGWLNLLGKQALLNQYSLFGFHNVRQVATAVGAFEIISGLFILLKPSHYILIFLLLWKIASELFYPHYEIFEWIERGGSYGVLLALYYIISPLKSYKMPAILQW